jgi:hypothetical protein
VQVALRRQVLRAVVAAAVAVAPQRLPMNGGWWVRSCHLLLVVLVALGVQAVVRPLRVQAAPELLVVRVPMVVVVAVVAVVAVVRLARNRVARVALVARGVQASVLWSGGSLTNAHWTTSFHV